MVIYAMSKSGTATSGLIYFAGFVLPSLRQTRAVAAKKFICRTGGLNLSGSPLLSEKVSFWVISKGGVHD